MTTQTATGVGERIAELDWAGLAARLDDDGFVQTPPVYIAAECRELAAAYDDGRFRSTIDMRRYRFGEGEYKYFDAPLPDLIEQARRALYPPLAELANEGAADIGEPAHLPASVELSLDLGLAPGQAGMARVHVRSFDG